ncbi:magnesium transporter [Nitratiruptor sp. YY08-26]|uniref:magnesium transporter n=1 Tax=unclassified Nitratiruptor TaxID=2624044 RepID=UPI0019156ED5|nr:MULTISPECIES: magnesium transporter [unclassified Nitratiruptor]BCD61507.1 magnesium transporter [Nitratiruptor sp. YY08-13]BCD65441.1 magnesium transporter [Nitratiruptor sp. YY08-26]
MQKDEVLKIRHILETELKSGEITLHPSEIAAFLKYLYSENKEEFFAILRKLPEEVLGEVLLELPESIKDEAIEQLSVKKLAKAVEELDSDDAVDLVKDIEDIDSDLEQKVLQNIDKEYKEEIETLSSYDESTAGAYMQTEVFKAYVDEKVKDAIERLRKLKAEGEVSNIHQVYVVDKDEKLKAIIPLEDLILYDFNAKFADIIHEKKYEPITVHVNEPVAEFIKKFEDYDLAVVAVVDDEGRLLGRITSDDVIDLIEEQATEQIYNLAGLEEEAEEEEDIKEVTKKRAWWLLINLGTAILASFVIGLFDETIQKYVALAVLMPIVASMGGNAGTQTLTVVVRKLALGEIDWQNAKKALMKETLVSLLNGLIFAVIMGAIAWIWFGNHLLGVVIALAMIINLLAAGFFGAVIPLFLKKVGQDPAVGSSVLLTTVTDVVGFFAFLGLAKVMLVH